MSRVHDVQGYMGSRVVVANQEVPANYSIDAVRVSICGPDGGDRTIYLSADSCRQLIYALGQALLEVRGFKA